MTFHYPTCRIFFLLILILLSPLDLTVNAQEGVLEGIELDVLYYEGLQKVAMETADIYPSIKKELERIIGWKVDFKPGVVLVGDINQFKMMSGNDLTVAYALPDRNIIVIDYSRIKTDPFDLGSILKHELCHLLLHDGIESERLPRWLDEGIAQWVSGGLADIVVEKRQVLTRAVLQNRIIKLKYLNEAFPDEEGMMALAYAESKDFIEYMIRLKGIEAILSILRSLSAGDDIDNAVMKTFSLSLDEMERDWHKSLEKKATWTSVVINNLYEALFFLAAVALIIGFYRVWRRKREYGAGDEDNEGQQGANRKEDREEGKEDREEGKE
ncbi:MAG: hypothetical protein JW944_07065 [Deltaproteobacteria bacterium]|nr:hypothetical protein [Deltaproteobacteria bacterium]